MAFDTDRDSCACGQVVIDAAADLEDQAVVVGGLVHGPIVCVRPGPGH